MIEEILNNSVNQAIKELWEDYRKAIKSHGYGAETKQIVVKIYSLTRRE